MTKKDYRTLAEVIGKFLASQDLASFLEDLEACFTRDNPRFNCEKWRDAVGQACQRWAEIRNKK